MAKPCTSYLELVANLPETSKLLALLIMGHGCRVEYKSQHWDSFFLVTIGATPSTTIRRRIPIMNTITRPDDEPVTHTDIDKRMAVDLEIGIQQMIIEGLISG